jgi:8-oxo-dGTP pyrophosphatase MutT (NUDIX family)
MKITELFENDYEHSQALEKTGFWGQAGAGCIFVAKDTKRILFQLRSPHVLQPNTWGVFGGAIDSNEEPVAAVMREIKEETGNIQVSDLIPAYVYNDPKTGFKYFNFIAVVENEFKPRPSEEYEWESAGYCWTTFNDWPEPLHFGARALVNDSKTLNIIKNI